ncbi:MAG: helix-turn-helix domain-containing protein [Cytophagaceae bacterium]
MPKNIPTYSINKFNRSGQSEIRYQVEVFDAHRHFQVEYPHRHHGFYEILYLREGSGKHVIDFKSYEIKPNSIFFLSPGQVHTLDLSDDIKGYIFLFTSEFYLLNKQNKNRLLEFPFFFHLQEETPPLHLPDSFEAEKMEKLFLSAIDALVLQDLEDRDETLAAILDLILLYCKQHYPVGQAIKNTQKGRLLVKRFKQLIEENYHLNFSVRDYAEKLAVSPNHLTETVRELTGRTSNDIIHERTIIEAKKLLKYTELTVTQIADQLHFKDQSYFARFFKKHAGINPEGFRKV